MEAGKKDSYGFTMAAVGLLIGFFLGAGIVYHFTSLDERGTPAGEFWMKIARVFDPAKQQGPTHLAGGNQTANTPASSGDIVPGGKPAFTTTAKATDGQTPGQAENNFSYELSDSGLLETAYLPIDGILDSTVLFSYYETRDRDMPSEPGHIRIGRDRLIGVRAYYLNEAETRQETNESTKVLDSLIGGTNPRGFRRRHVFYVEFWESPLNYLSYVMNRNRLIVYGIDQPDMVRILEFDSNLYIKFDEQYYLLELTNEVKVMVPESNPDQIRKLEPL